MLLLKKAVEVILYIYKYILYLYIGIRTSTSKPYFNNTLVIKIKQDNIFWITLGYQNHTVKHNSDNPDNLYHLLIAFYLIL